MKSMKDMKNELSETIVCTEHLNEGLKSYTLNLHALHVLHGERVIWPPYGRYCRYYFREDFGIIIPEAKEDADGIRFQ